MRGRGPGRTLISTISRRPLHSQLTFVLNSIPGLPIKLPGRAIDRPSGLGLRRCRTRPPSRSV